MIIDFTSKDTSLWSSGICIVTVSNNSPIQNYVHLDDQTQPTFFQETLYCQKEIWIADIPLSGVSGVVGAVCCVMCAEVVWEMVGRSRVGCKVTEQLGETMFVWATLVQSICLSLCPAEFSVGIVGLK